MADPIACPNCGAHMEFSKDFYDHACAQCGLAGPQDVLAGLAARLAPVAALDEALAKIEFYPVMMLIRGIKELEEDAALTRYPEHGPVWEAIGKLVATLRAAKEARHG